jgi:branched-subunit amino acid transport protein
MSAWMAVILAGVFSMALRASFAMRAERQPAPAWVGRLTVHVMPAAFAALAATALVGHVARGDLHAVPIVTAVAATVVVAGRGQRPHRALAAGLVAMWAVGAVVS